MKYNSVEEYLLDWPEGVSGGKGDGVAKDQLARNNKIEDTAIARQNSLQDKAISATQGDLSGNNGFSPELLSYLQSQFLNQNTGSFQSANSNVHAALAAHGSGNGDLPVGGDFSRNIAELESAKASSQSQGMLGLGIQNLQQALNNKYNAANVMTGNAAQVGGTVGASSSAGSNALNQYVYASNQGFGNAFTSGFGKAFGTGLGGLATNAVGLAAGQAPGMGGLKPPGAA